MTKVSESLPSTTCRSSTELRVNQSRDKGNWMLNSLCSISSSSTMSKASTRCPVSQTKLPRSPSIRFQNLPFNIDCFRLTKTSSEHVLRTSPINMIVTGKISASTSCSLLSNFIRMSTVLHHNQSISQSSVWLPISLTRRCFTIRSSGSPINHYHRWAIKTKSLSRVARTMNHSCIISSLCVLDNSRLNLIKLRVRNSQSM